MLSRTVEHVLIFTLLGGMASPSRLEAQQAGAAAQMPLLRTTVRRVVVDVVVTDKAGAPVRGLTRDDFKVEEDGASQQILSFEANGFRSEMDYVPPKLPVEPVNTFVNLPETAEKGPLYVLLYDLVNADMDFSVVGPSMDHEQHPDQMWGRQQLVRFIQSKPEGSRFAIFVRSDGLHLIQGFTSDKAKLYAAIDPHRSRPHIPMIYLMGEEMGRGSVSATIASLKYIGQYLDGFPGRKNLVWFSSGFPLTFSVGDFGDPFYLDEVRSTLNLLAQDEIAIYPVSMQGVLAHDIKGEGTIYTGPPVNGGSAPPPLGSQAKAAQSSILAGAEGGPSEVRAGQFQMDEIAELTGGRAFYSTNDAAGALAKATEHGESYYTLSYSPSNQNYDGKLRSIQVKLEEKGYRLDYRRAYYGLRPGAAPAVEHAPKIAKVEAGNAVQSDALDAYMRHGAPVAHQLIFGVHVHPVETTAGSAKLVSSLPDGAQPRHKDGAKQPQTIAIDYTVMTHQLQAHAGAAVRLKVAATIFDKDGAILKSVVDDATRGDDAAVASPSLRLRQMLEVPAGGATVRVGVRDESTGRIGAMEIALPLAAEAAVAVGAGPGGGD